MSLCNSLEFVEMFCGGLLTPEMFLSSNNADNRLYITCSGTIVHLKQCFRFFFRIITQISTIKNTYFCCSSVDVTTKISQWT